MDDFEGVPCALCGDGLANVQEGETATACPFCSCPFHSDCLNGHFCAEMQEHGDTKLLAWVVAAEGAVRGCAVSAIYLGARYSRCEEMLRYAVELEALGHTVTSRWIKGGHQITDEQLGESTQADELGRRYADEDLEDLHNADLCIFFTEPPRTTNSRGGRHVEFGIAWAKQIECWIVGPKENVFHCLPGIQQFETWPECLAALKGRDAEA